MNIKNLRKNYDGLTMLERLALADNAEARDDEGEIRAINAASPKLQFKQVDFYDLMQEIKLFRLCNLICRLGYVMQFDYFYHRAEIEILKNELSSSEYEKHIENAQMAAFLYFRAKHSWQSVNDDLGLRSGFDEEMSEHLFSIALMEAKEIMMGELTATEDEATARIREKYGDGKAKSLEEEANDIREALGLSKK